MRDRAFGVEIECGYNGDGDAGPPDCDCLYNEDTDSYESESGHCVACCGCYDGETSLGCEEAERLLASNGFGEWTHDIHQDGSGVEIPSPILRGVEGLYELREVMQLLSRNGFYTTPEDGMHVHHDAPEFVKDPELTARLVELWEENLPIIDRFVAEHRRGGTYWACNSYRLMGPSYEEAWRKFKESKSLDDLYADKFRSLNITPLRYHGTVEFRLHQGTLDFDKAAAWIKFGQGLLDRAVQRKTIVTCASAYDVLKVAGVSRKTVRTLMEAAA
jgi:hypothetical protein